MNTVDVIIPTYKPGQKLIKLLTMLEKQTVKPRRVILYNTEEKYFDAFLGTKKVTDLPCSPEVHHVSQLEFNHGGTRALAVEASDAEAFLCMTDDAIPKDMHLIEEMLRSLSRDNVAVVYARQLATKESGPVECYTRRFNYPDKSRDKTMADLQELGIKTFFCSNVCAMYNRSIYNLLGGFVKRTLFNEDMIYAGGAVQKGYTIAYCAKALVYHSHRYGPVQQFHRNFDLGVSQTEHPEVFAGISSEGEGLKMVKQTCAFLWKHHRKGSIPGYIVNTAFRYAGYRLGKGFRRLPLSIVKRCTTQPHYFER